MVGLVASTAILVAYTQWKRPVLPWAVTLNLALSRHTGLGAHSWPGQNFWKLAPWLLALGRPEKQPAMVFAREGTTRGRPPKGTPASHCVVQGDCDGRGTGETSRTLFRVPRWLWDAAMNDCVCPYVSIPRPPRGECVAGGRRGWACSRPLHPAGV